MVKIIFLLSCALLFSCASKELSVQELNSYILNDENGLHHSLEINGTRMDVIHRPIDLLIHQRVGNEPLEKLVLDSLRKNYASYYYFILSLSINNDEALHQVNQTEYSNLLNNLSFRMDQFVTLTTQAMDTIPVADFIINRTYGLSSSTEILFVFNNHRLKGKKWVQFNINEFGLSTGTQRFKFSTEAIENSPNVKFKVTI